MEPVKRWAMALAAASSLMGLPAQAEPQSHAETPGAPESRVAEAQARFRRALELYQEGNLDAARTELRRAYQTAPSYKVLYNLGQVEFELHDYPAALTTFEKYLAEGADKIPKERRLQVQNDIEKLRGRLATLEITVNIPNARVLIDDVSVGTTPLGRLQVVGAGRRRIAVSRPGFATETRIVDLGGGDHSTVNVDLQETSHATAPAAAPPAAVAAAPLSGTASPPVEPPPTQNEIKGGSSIPWAGWGATVLLAAGAAATGIIALDASNRLSEERNRLGADRGELDRLETQVTSFALASDICTGSAAFAGVLSLYLTVAPSRTQGIERGGSVRIAPSPKSIAVVGTF